MLSAKTVAASALALAWLSFVPAARAQDTAFVASFSEPAQAVLHARFVEARGAGDWKQADDAWRELIERWPAYEKDAHLTLDHVGVLRALGRTDEARSALEGLLALEPENMLAAYELGVLQLGASGTDAERRHEEAKELLLLAARNGLPVLRELRVEKGPGVAAVLRDPRFILAAIDAGRSFDAARELALAGEKVRNPFTLPPRGTIADMLRGPADVDPEQKRFAKELAEAVKAKDREREAALRAQALEAERKRKIAALDLLVTGIVVDARPDGRSRAVIACADPERRGRIYEEGDALRDRDARRIVGLKVVEIREGAVRLDWDGYAFTCQLKAPTP